MQDPFADLHTIIKNPRRTAKKTEDVPTSSTTVPSVSSLPQSIIPTPAPVISTSTSTASTASTTPTKKYSDDYDPFSSISTMAGIKKPVQAPPAPVPAPAPAMLSMQIPTPAPALVSVPIQAPVIVQTTTHISNPTNINESINITQPIIPLIPEPTFDDFDNFKKPEVKEITPPQPVVTIQPPLVPVIHRSVEPELKFDEIYQKQDPDQADADFLAFNSNSNTNTNSIPSVVIVDDGLFTSFSESTVKTTSDVTVDEYDNFLDVFDKPAKAPAPAPAPTPATLHDDDNYDPFESNSNKVDPFKNQKNTMQKQQPKARQETSKARQETSHQQQATTDDYDHIEYESDDDEDDEHRGSFGRVKGTSGSREDNNDLANFPKEGPILGRVSTRTLFAQKEWSDLYWALENDVLILFRSRTDYEYNKSRAEVKKRIPIQHTHRVLKIKTKEYKGYGVLHNFMLEEVMDYGPANIAKFGSTDRHAVEQLNSLIKAIVLKIRKSLQAPTTRR